MLGVQCVWVVRIVKDLEVLDINSDFGTVTLFIKVHLSGLYIQTVDRIGVVVRMDEDGLQVCQLDVDLQSILRLVQAAFVLHVLRLPLDLGAIQSVIIELALHL